MSESFVDISNDRCIENNLRDIRHILSENHSDIKKRNEALLFCGPISNVPARLGTAVSDVKVSAIKKIHASVGLDDVK
jgi:mediator of RNA polymerase II transcription subunit 12, fungi type